MCSFALTALSFPSSQNVVLALLDDLKGRGLDRDTLVVFLSDKGGSGNGDTAPPRGKKSTMWEGGLRVPFIARWPGRLPAGRVTDEFLTALELLPTFAAAADATLPDVKLDGFDALPVLDREFCLTDTAGY